MRLIWVKPGWTRASDGDREEVVALLGDAFVAGRLTRDELGERCEAAYAATTWGDLDVLTADLPVALPAVRLVTIPPSGTVVPRGARRPDNRVPLWPLGAFILVLGVLMAALAESASLWATETLTPSVRPDFSGHQLCDPAPYVQGLHDPAPFHPTAAGELDIALADEHALLHGSARSQPPEPSSSPWPSG